MYNSRFYLRFFQRVLMRIFLGKVLWHNENKLKLTSIQQGIIMLFMLAYFTMGINMQAKENQEFLPQKPITAMQGSFLAWYQQCMKKNYASCGLVGRAYYEGYGVIPNVMRAQQYLTKACYNGIVESCLILGNFTQKFAKQEYKVLLYQQACDLDHKESCISLSDILLNQIKKDSTQTQKQQLSTLLRKICKLENDVDCLRAQAFDAQFNNTNTLAAIQFQQDFMACNKAQEEYSDNLKVCGEVGIKYANGIGVTRDKEQAQTYFHIACQKHEEFCRYEVLDSILN